MKDAKKFIQYASNCHETLEINLLKMLCQENKRLIFNSKVTSYNFKVTNSFITY